MQTTAVERKKRRKRNEGSELRAPALLCARTNAMGRQSCPHPRLRHARARSQRGGAELAAASFRAIRRPSRRLQENAKKTFQPFRASLFPIRSLSSLFLTPKRPHRRRTTPLKQQGQRWRGKWCFLRGSMLLYSLCRASRSGHPEQLLAPSKNGLSLLPSFSLSAHPRERVQLGTVACACAILSNKPFARGGARGGELKKRGGERRTIRGEG